MKRPAFLIPAVFAAVHPFQVFAQQTQQLPPWDWPGPWHMWSGGWGFWWTFPVFMMFMIIICVAILFLGHRTGSGHHHWGPWQMMDRGRS